MTAGGRPSLFLRPALTCCRLWALAFKGADVYEACFVVPHLSDDFELVSEDPRCAGPAVARGRSRFADPSRSPHPVWTKISAAIKAFLLVAVGDLEKLAAKALAEVPLSDLAWKAGTYFAVITGVLCPFTAGPFTAALAALLVTLAVLVLNAVRLALHPSV